MSMPSTFGGGEIGCRIGSKVLEITSNPDFLNHVDAMAARLAVHYQQLSAKHAPVLAEVRQKGLASALKLSMPMGGIKMMSALFRNGVLAIIAGFDLSVIQIKPPLIIDAHEIDQLADAIDRSLTEIAADA